MVKIFGFDITVGRIVEYGGMLLGFLGLCVTVLQFAEGVLPPEYAAVIGTVSAFLMVFSTALRNFLNILMARKEVNGSYRVPVETDELMGA